MLFAGVEAGGTKVIVGFGTSPGDLQPRVRIPTTTPTQTIARIIEVLKQGNPNAIGIASFGPLGLQPGRPDFGSISNTPKPGWKNTPLVAPIASALGVPVTLDTDVNAAALAESTWGAGKGVPVLLYLTVGTGVGGGVVIDGSPLHGLSHPEMGHLQIRRRSGDDRAGSCPFHPDCLEGRVSGPALALRWGVSPESLEDGHPVWQAAGRSLAEGIYSLICSLSPGRIVLGGGVGARGSLLEATRRSLADVNGGYLPLPPLEEFLVPPALGENAGILGAIVLAARAAGQTI